ncbi:hypothetical protein [uncultured Microbacterium sp.]|uniref:hypothetical protein n=1 Tax=uncultured Microbacterium sp. TaxID=191216 RepID=UPI0028D454F7|nr:hypothetical protein [uncultured Microbacterium sp.]
MGVAIPAGAAPPVSNSSPVATANATVTGNSVVVLSTVNRAAKQIRQPVFCTLDGATADCGLQGPTSKKLTSYSTTLTGVGVGTHTFAVTFTLTDGGAAGATVEFNISPPPTPQESCIALGGDFALGNRGYTWTCQKFLPPYFADGAESILAAACGGVYNGTWVGWENTIRLAGLYCF